MSLPYDAGLGKSNFLNTREETRIENKFPSNEENSNKNPQLLGDDARFKELFIDEISLMLKTLESLYIAIRNIDDSVADDLLYQAFQDLRKAVRQIAADFSLGVHTSLSKPRENITASPKEETIKQSSTEEQPTKEIPLKENSTYDSDNDPLLAPRRKGGGYTKPERSTRSGPINVGF